MQVQSLSLEEFVSILGSKEPVPGGGGASAVTAAVGTALGNMVGSLTVGKKQYAEVEAEMYDLCSRCDTLQMELLALAQRDAQVFERLMEAYHLPKETAEELEERAAAVENSLHTACEVPLEIMEKCCTALDILSEFAEKGSENALSDAGVGAVCCKAALQGAALNVLINIRSMRDEKSAVEYKDRMDQMLREHEAKADEIYRVVWDKLAVNHTD